MEDRIDKKIYISEQIEKLNIEYKVGIKNEKDS